MLSSLALVCCITANAQDSDKLEFYGGYSYLRSTTIVVGFQGVNQNGFEASAQYKFLNWLGAVADVSGDYGANAPHTVYYLFGPQISWPARVSPFAHVLIGGGHSSGITPADPSFSGNDSFAVAVGGGIDAKIVGHVSWRIIQADWIHSSPFGEGKNNARVSTGIVVRF